MDSFFAFNYSRERRMSRRSHKLITWNILPPGGILSQPHPFRGPYLDKCRALITRSRPLNSAGAGNSLWSCRFRASNHESVNHEASTRKTGWEQICLPINSSMWNEFAFGPDGRFFLCCNQFFFSGNVELTFPFLQDFRITPNIDYACATLRLTLPR